MGRFGREVRRILTAAALAAAALGAAVPPADVAQAQGFADYGLIGERPAAGSVSTAAREPVGPGGGDFDPTRFPMRL